MFYKKRHFYIFQIEKFRIQIPLIVQQKSTFYTKANLESISCCCSNCTAIIAPTLKCNEALLHKFLTFFLPKSKAGRIQVLNSTAWGVFFRTRCPQVAAPLLSEPVFSSGQYFSRSMRTPWCTQRLSPIGKVTCIRQMREPRCEMPRGHFCHSSCSRATLSWLNNGSEWEIPQAGVHKRCKLYLSSLKQSAQSIHFTICLSYLVVQRCKLL